MILRQMEEYDSKSRLRGVCAFNCSNLPQAFSFRSGEEDKKVDHTGEPDKKRGKVQKKSMLSFDENEEDEEYR